MTKSEISALENMRAAGKSSTEIAALCYAKRRCITPVGKHCSFTYQATPA